MEEPIGDEWSVATDRTADLSSRQLPLPSVLQVLILPVCALEEARERMQEGQICCSWQVTVLAARKSEQEAQQSDGFQASCALYSRGYLRFLISNFKHYLHLLPPSLTVCLETEGKDSCPSRSLPAALWVFLTLGAGVAFLKLLIPHIISPPRDFRVLWPVSSAISTLLQFRPCMSLSSSPANALLSVPPYFLAHERPIEMLSAVRWTSWAPHNLTALCHWALFLSLSFLRVLLILPLVAIIKYFRSCVLQPHTDPPAPEAESESALPELTVGLGPVSSLAQVTSLEQDRTSYMIQVQSIRDKSPSAELIPFSST